MFLLIDIPTPTPPITGGIADQINSATQAINRTIETANQANSTAVVILAIVLLGALVYILRGVFNAQNNSQNTLTRLYEKQDERMDKLEETIRKTTETNQMIIQELGKKHVEGLTAMSDAVNKQADNERLTATNIQQANTIMRELSTAHANHNLILREMYEQGSKPLQSVAVNVEKVLENTNKILTSIVESIGSNDKITQAITNIEFSIRELKKTKTQPLPIVTEDMLTDGKPSA